VEPPASCCPCVPSRYQLFRLSDIHTLHRSLLQLPGRVIAWPELCCSAVGSGTEASNDARLGQKPRATLVSTTVHAQLSACRGQEGEQQPWQGQGGKLRTQTYRKIVEHITDVVVMMPTPVHSQVMILLGLTSTSNAMYLSPAYFILPAADTNGLTVMIVECLRVLCSDGQTRFQREF
jgi:hypothetical protein